LESAVAADQLDCAVDLVVARLDEREEVPNLVDFGRGHLPECTHKRQRNLPFA